MIRHELCTEIRKDLKSKCHREEGLRNHDNGSNTSPKRGDKK